MADNTTPAWRGNALQRFGRGFVDRVLPGNQRAPDGTLQNVGSGALGLGLRVGGGLVGGPIGGIIGAQVGTNVGNHGLSGAGNFDGNTTNGARLVRGLGRLLGGGTPDVIGTPMTPRGIPDTTGNPGAQVTPLEAVLNSYRGTSPTPTNTAGVPRSTFDPNPQPVQGDPGAAITPLARSAFNVHGAVGQYGGNSTYASRGNYMTGIANGSGGNPLAAGVGRGGAGVIEGEAAQDWMRAAHQSIFGNRQQGTDPRGNTLAQ